MPYQPLRTSLQPPSDTLATP